MSELNPSPSQIPSGAPDQPPQTRLFPIQSFGPGAAADICTTARSLRDINAEVTPEMYTQAGLRDYDAKHDETRELLKEVENWSRVDYSGDDNEEGKEDADPTWGYYVFITDYSTYTDEHLSGAIENLIKVVQRSLTRFTIPPYARETFHRFKLDVIQDKDILDGASDDRIREEFRAQISGMKLFNDVGGLCYTPARNMVCLVFDRETIEMLSSLSFPEDVEEDFDKFRKNTVKVLDNCYRGEDGPFYGERAFPRIKTASYRVIGSLVPTYRGVGDCPIASLDRFYMFITSGANPGAMEDMHPISPESYEI